MCTNGNKKFDWFRSFERNFQIIFVKLINNCEENAKEMTV